jgi:hypothetical protein
MTKKMIIATRKRKKLERGSIQAKVLGMEEGARKMWLLCPQFSTTDSHSKY